MYLLCTVAIAWHRNSQNSMFDLCSYHDNPILIAQGRCHPSSMNQEDHSMRNRHLWSGYKERDLVHLSRLGNNMLAGAQKRKKSRDP